MCVSVIQTSIRPRAASIPMRRPLSSLGQYLLLSPIGRGSRLPGSAAYSRQRTPGGFKNFCLEILEQQRARAFLENLGRAGFLFGHLVTSASRRAGAPEYSQVERSPNGPISESETPRPSNVTE